MALNKYRLEVHEDGRKMGRLEIDRFSADEEDIVFIEVFDHTVFEGDPQSACLAVSLSQARKIAASLMEMAEGSG